MWWSSQDTFTRLIKGILLISHTDSDTHLQYKLSQRREITLPLPPSMSMDAAPRRRLHMWIVNSAITMRRRAAQRHATNGGVRFVKHKGFVRPCEEFLQRGMQLIRCPAATEDRKRSGHYWNFGGHCEYWKFHHFVPFLQACFLHENIIEFIALYSVMSLLFGPQFEEWQNTKNIMEEAVNRVTAYRSGAHWNNLAIEGNFIPGY